MDKTPPFNLLILLGFILMRFYISSVKLLSVVSEDNMETHNHRYRHLDFSNKYLSDLTFIRCNFIRCDT